LARFQLSYQRFLFKVLRWQDRDKGIVFASSFTVLKFNHQAEPGALKKLVRTCHMGSSGEQSIHRGLQRSAIGLDLNGDGIQTVSQQSRGVEFDVDGTGYAKQTTWVGKQDAMLVLDRNFNSVIDSGNELFGNTQVALGAQGLKGLAWVDANVDGNIDASDAVNSQLRVWQDGNGNGLHHASNSPKFLISANAI